MTRTNTNTEQERAEFEALFKHLDLTQEPDAWGVPRYKHGTISLAWGAWQAARRAPVPQGMDARDAARYRWLRDNDWRNDEKMEPVIRLHLNAIWDEKIDAAMAAQARNKKGIEQ